MFSKATVSTMLAMLLSCACLMLGQEAPPKSGAGEDWRAVEAAMGRSGAMQPGDVFKFGIPRKDMQVTVEGTPIQPALALGSWVAFRKMGGEAIRNGIEVTAIHSHMLREEPRLFFLHFWAKDDALKLGKGLRAALDQTNSAK